MILFNVWWENPAKIILSWNELNNNILNNLSKSFKSHVDFYTGSRLASCSLEQICKHLRHYLASTDDEFTFSRYASMYAIMNQLVAS